jgi:hypothetical protein
MYRHFAVYGRFVLTGPCDDAVTDEDIRVFGFIDTRCDRDTVLEERLPH